MKVKIKQSLKWSVPLLLIGGIGVLRCCTDWAEWYSCHWYPVISAGLSLFSSLFPVSVGDCFIAGACLGVLCYPFYAWWKRKKWWKVIENMVIFFMWIYIWFYMAWGINYFRQPFYERIGKKRVDYSETEFQSFLEDYVKGLVENYDSGGKTGDWYTEPLFNRGKEMNKVISEEINNGYRQIAERFGMVKSTRKLYPKYMLWSGGMSKVGVSGYMGPFFSEFNLNREMLNVEYPFTYAHELAHRLGIASEAEANLYAAIVTMNASVPEIRFSGFFSILGYVMNNARRLLTAEGYKALLSQIPSEIVGMYNQHLMYWREKYAPDVGKVQNKVYNAYLKSNKIETGTKNYSEVIGLLMSFRRYNNGKFCETIENYQCDQQRNPANKLQCVVIQQNCVGLISFDWRSMSKIAVKKVRMKTEI